MTDEVFHAKLRLALRQKPEGFEKALKVVKDGMSRNSFEINGLQYVYCDQSDVVTVMCKGAIVGLMTQEFFQVLVKHRR